MLPDLARIEGATIRTAVAGLVAPDAVRYGWHSDPDCNVYNGVGLSASPFTTAPRPPDSP